MEGGEGDDRVRWGTWEELILGGAILRHGSRAWDAVALELQTRTLHPYLFTPQVCKDKYEELLKSYSGNSAWFEEIKRRRIEELRRALEKSEDSIGSLESKLVSLKAKKEVNINADYSSSRDETPIVHISEGDGSSGREVFKDGSSAGSFTEETPTTWAPQCQVGTVVSGDKAETEPRRLEKFPSIEKLAESILSKHGVSIRRRRGKRRRKDLTKDAKEGSVGENNLLGTNDSTPPVGLLDVNDQNPCTSKSETDDFMKILDSVMANEHASVFQHRHDSQRRARYKKMVRQHMDLDIIKSRIATKRITSTVELLRDLLLLANNALVFYSKTTREYKCALVIRDLATKRSHQQRELISLVPSEIPKSPVCKPPVKPRSVRPFNRKFNNRTPIVEVGSNVGVKEQKPPPSNVSSPSSAESSILTKKNSPRKGKVSRVKRGNAGIQAETPMKVRKRARVK